jgi:hypothetical protein
MLDMPWELLLCCYAELLHVALDGLMLSASLCCFCCLLLPAAVACCSTCRMLT